MNLNEMSHFKKFNRYSIGLLIKRYTSIILKHKKIEPVSLGSQKSEIIQFNVF